MNQLVQLWHILPINDLKPHIESKDCWCRPLVEDGICVHNSMDGREKHEKGVKLH